MPPPRKTDLLPPELQDWLKNEVEKRGFADYEALAGDLNQMLEDKGLALRIQKTSLHNFGQEHRAFVKLSEEASAWTKSWMTGEGLASEAESHKVLFQMIQNLAFKVMKAMMDEDREVDPKELHFLGRTMKDVIQSAGIREKLLADERERIEKEAREAAADEAEAVVKEMGLDDTSAALLRKKLLGIAA